MKNIPLIAEKSQLGQSKIGQSPLFSGLDSEQFDSVLSHTKISDLKEGDFLFSQGQPAESFFWLESGKVKLTVGSASGMEKVITIILPGQTFAEAIMFGSHPVYPVAAAAIISSRVWSINTSHYTGILRNSADACFAVMAQMSQRLHWQVGEIDRLSLHNATSRVVSYLLEQTSSNFPDASLEVDLDIPKHLLASRLSITPETLSRTFLKLSQLKLIEIKEQHILLKDILGLKNCID